MNSEVEIAEVDSNRRIILPEKIREGIGIDPHDKLVLGVINNKIILTKQKRSVFDLQLKEVAKGTPKKSAAV